MYVRICNFFITLYYVMPMSLYSNMVNKEIFEFEFINMSKWIFTINNYKWCEPIKVMSFQLGKGKQFCCI